MTTGVAAAAVDPAVATRMTAVAPASQSIAGDSGPTDAWVHMGSEAQFGPTAPYVLYGGGNAWPTTPPGSSPDASPEQAKLDAAFAKQSTDIQAIQDKSEVTPRLLASLRTAREAVAAQAGRPDEALLKTFEDDAQKVRESGDFTEAQQKQLKDEYTAVLKSANVSDDAIASLFAAQDAVKAASHVTSDDVVRLAADQHAVQTLVDAMPYEAVAFAGADASRANAAGAPIMHHGGAAVNSSQGAAFDPNADPATLAATSAPAAAATAPAPAVYARALAMARGTSPEGGLSRRFLGRPSAQPNGAGAPIARVDASNVALMNSALKRSSHRSIQNLRVGATMNFRRQGAGRPGPVRLDGRVAVDANRPVG